MVPRSVMDRRSLRYKRRLLTVNFLCMAAALYCYWRHNTRCEPGVCCLYISRYISTYVQVYLMKIKQ